MYSLWILISHTNYKSGPENSKTYIKVENEIMVVRTNHFKGIKRREVSNVKKKSLLP